MPVQDRALIFALVGDSPSKARHSGQFTLNGSAEGSDIGLPSNPVPTMNPKERLRDVISCSHRLIWYAAMFPQPMACDGAWRACVGCGARGGYMFARKGTIPDRCLKQGRLLKSNRDATTPVIVPSELPSLALDTPSRSPM